MSLRIAALIIAAFSAILSSTAARPEAPAKARAEGDSWVINDDFRADPIPDAVFARMNGKSYKQDCTVPRSELRYVSVLISDGKGGKSKGEMVVNKLIAKDVVEIFYQLCEAGYAIERMRLIDDYDADDTSSMEANNTSAFNFRKVAGTQRLSNHARGLAIDINPLYNPWVRTKKGKTLVDPPSARKYADRASSFPYKIDRNDLAYKLFTERGFTWGGSWKSSKDYQHFEKKY